MALLDNPNIMKPSMVGGNAVNFGDYSAHSMSPEVMTTPMPTRRPSWLAQGVGSSYTPPTGAISSGVPAIPNVSRIVKQGNSFSNYNVPPDHVKAMMTQMQKIGIPQDMILKVLNNEGNFGY